MRRGLDDGVVYLGVGVLAVGVFFSLKTLGAGAVFGAFCGLDGKRDLVNREAQVTGKPFGGAVVDEGILSGGCDVRKALFIIIALESSCGAGRRPFGGWVDESRNL